MRKKIILLLTLGLCLFGVSPTTITAEQVTDIAGREIHFEEPVTKIVTLLPADAEILTALDASDVIIGRSDLVNYPDELEEIPVVSSNFTNNLEAIIELEPELVIMSLGTDEAEIEQLERVGIQVMLVDATTLEGVYEQITQLGQLIDKEDEAASLVEAMQSSFALYQEKTKDALPQTIYFEISPLEFGLWTGGKGTFLQELAETLNLTNIFEEIDGWQEISQESLIERDPTFIVSLVEGEEIVEEIKERAGWSEVTAVKKDQVYDVDSDIFSRPGPRLVEALEKLYELVYE